MHREWPIGDLSHTELMQRLATEDDPDTIDALVRIATGG
jgi:hypothetical protein